MIDQNGSDPMFGKESDADDQDIIELTNEVVPEPTPDDEILELTLEADASEGDEEIIELTSEVEETTGEANDEEILELTSEAEETTKKTVLEVLESDDKAPGAIAEMEQDEEDLLNLLSDEPEETVESQPAAVIGEEIPETASVDDIEFHEPADTDSQTDLPLKDIELASVMGVELDPARDLSLESLTDGIEVELHDLEKNESRDVPHIIIPRKQLEAAIERAIESKLSEKIDRLLTDAIEKAVATEICRLKNLLTNDSPGE